MTFIVPTLSKKGGDARIIKPGLVSKNDINAIFWN
jgi:hypothetical protein